MRRTRFDAFTVVPLPDIAEPRSIHLTRLLSIWRSAGWPCKDAIELDLLAAQWICVDRDSAGRETLRLTQAGMQLLVAARRRRSRSSSAHDRLAARVCAQLASEGRIVWQELMLRGRGTSARPPGISASTLALKCGEDSVDGFIPPPDEEGVPYVWRIARPDVFSIRNTSVAHYLFPMVHEIKVSRADLLSDLRNPSKREAYRWLSCETFYVFPVGLADAEEIPADFGILTLVGSLDDGKFEMLRPARHAPRTLPFGVWMALAKATPFYDELADPLQGELSAVPEHP